MSEIKRKIEENIEDVERISNILNQRQKKSDVRLGGPSLKNNPFLNLNGGFSLVETWPSYKNKKKRKNKR